MKGLLSTLLLISALILFAEEKPYIVSAGPMENPYIELANDVVIDLYKNIGMEIVVEETSMERSLSKVRSGQVDVELFRTINLKGRFSEIILVEEPMFYLDIVALYRDSRIEISSWESLEELRITYVRGVKSIESALKDFSGIYVSDDITTALTLLKNGRVDVVVAGELNSLKALKHINFEESPYISPPLLRISAHHVLNLRHIGLKERLNEKIKQLEISTYFDKIIK